MQRPAFSKLTQLQGQVEQAVLCICVYLHNRNTVVTLLTWTSAVDVGLESVLYAGKF